MKSTSFKETNQIMKAGNNPGTNDIPICRAVQQIEGQNMHTIVTKFKLSPEELERINETGELWVTILGVSMPPILPTVLNPFTELGYKALDL